MLFSGKCNSNAMLDNKVAVVTGCNGGIGKVTALEFYKRGARVIMACRNLESARRAADDIKEAATNCANRGEIVVLELNLASFKSVRKCAEEILASEDRIHLLVNNAGTYNTWELTEDGHEIMFEVNYLGHFLFTLLLLPRIITAAPARIVNITSLLYTFAGGEMKFDDITLKHSFSPIYAYARSRLANILFTKELGQRLKGFGVTTYAVHPGLVNTSHHQKAAKVLHPIARPILHSSLANFLYKKSAEQGAQTTLHCALNEEAEKESGLFYSDCKPLKPDKTARDRKKAKELWDFSWDSVGLPKDYNPFTHIEVQQKD